MPIRYCFDNTFNAAQLAAVKLGLSDATDAWSRVARITFQHVSGLDGASCTQGQTGKDIVVTKAPDTGSAGTFPGQVLQQLIMSTTATQGVFLHELGHVLGFGHEQFHSKSGLGCTVVVPPVPSLFGVVYADLNPEWDPASVMQYYNNDGQPSCDGGTSMVNLSAGDGDGARALYP